MENVEYNSEKIQKKEFSKKEFYKQAAIAAVGIALIACLPQYVNWGFNETIFAVWSSSTLQLVGVAVILYSHGKKVAIASDCGDGYSFGRAYGFAMMCSLMAGVMCAVLSWLLNNVIDPNIAKEMLDKTREMAMMQNMNEAQMEVAVQTSKFFTSFGGLLIVNVFSMAVFGGLIGLIVSALVKRNPTL